MKAVLLASVHLVELLERENGALARLDFASATALLAPKRCALADFERAIAEAAEIASARDREQGAELRAIAARLLEASSENKRLLERAMRVQQHIMSLLAQASSRAAPERGYGVRGTHVGRLAATPFALSAKV